MTLGPNSVVHFDELDEYLDVSSSMLPQYNRHPEPEYRPYVPKNNSIAQAKKDGGSHEHRREIARRIRQQSKK